MSFSSDLNPPSRKYRPLLFVLIPLALVPILFLTFNHPSFHVPNRWTEAIPKFSPTNHFSFTTAPSASPTPSPSPDETPAPSAARLHILIPANKGNTNLCKSVLSIVLLGYGMPILYGWKGSESLMGKITSFNPYLLKLDSTHDDDIVLITDGFDVWFQLPPQVFIDRFHAANQRATERSRNLYKESSIRKNSTYVVKKKKEYKQGVILASQKKCWPGDEDSHVSCLAAPESSLLPKDVYGPDTDQILEDKENPYEHVRRRYLNAGFVMGAVRDLRPLWERAMEKAEADMDVFGHDQHVLSEIFGEQEVARHVAAGGEAIGKSGSEEKGMYPFEPEEDVRYEFGVGLDYASELSLPTVFGSDEIAWVSFSNKTSISEAAKEAQIPDALVGAKKLPTELREHRPGPFRTTAKDRFAAHMGWEDVPILTDLYTGVSPALIHHNEWRDHKKDRIQTWWEKIWFQPLGRSLLESIMRSSGDAIAVDRNGREWKSAVPSEAGLGVRTMSEEGTIGWLDWDELCGGDDEQEVLFTDGKGKWNGILKNYP